MWLQQPHPRHPFEHVSLITPQMCPCTWCRRAGAFGELLCPAVICLPSPGTGKMGPGDGNREMLQRVPTSSWSFTPGGPTAPWAPLLMMLGSGPATSSVPCPLLTSISILSILQAKSHQKDHKDLSIICCKEVSGPTALSQHSHNGHSIASTHPPASLALKES